MRKYDIDGITLIKRNATLKTPCPDCGCKYLKDISIAFYKCWGCGKYINKWVKV
jgi:ribosomal protein L37AE/L43A